MHPQIAEAFARLPDYLGGHVAVSLTRRWRSGWRSACRWRWLATRRPALRQLLLGAASLVQTIPGLALLALFYPLLLGIAALCERAVRRRLLRARISAVGAGADALQHAAGAAEHDHRPQGVDRRDQARRRSASA